MAKIRHFWEEICSKKVALIAAQTFMVTNGSLPPQSVAAFLLSNHIENLLSHTQCIHDGASPNEVDSKIYKTRNLRTRDMTKSQASSLLRTYKCQIARYFIYLFIFYVGVAGWLGSAAAHSVML